MNFSLSGGPILEPLLGIVISIIIIFLMLIYFIKIILKSDFYKNEYSEFNNIKKIVAIILFLSILISVVLLTFFILSMSIAVIIMTIKKWI